MKITTSHDYPPIPTRNCDWSAIDSDTYDGAPDTHPPCPIGRGPTEEAAIRDLLEQIEDRDEIGAEEVREYRRDNGQFGVGA